MHFPLDRLLDSWYNLCNSKNIKKNLEVLLIKRIDAAEKRESEVDVIDSKWKLF
jgi:hypothetical protein